MATDRLVITGCGIVGPAGLGVDALWAEVAAGHTLAQPAFFASARCDRPDLALSNSVVNGARPPSPVPLTGRLPADVASRLTWPDQRVASMMLLAAQEAIEQAGWSDIVLSDPSTGLCAATSKGDVSAMLAHRLRVSPADPRPEPQAHCCSTTAIRSSRDATGFLASLPNGPGMMIADRLGHHHGPRICSVAACATGTHALIRAAQLIRDGDADRVLVVAGDASLCPLLVAAFANMGVLTRDACRPFDRDRSGFFIAEGAAAVTIERADRACSRASVELAGWLLAADPTGLIAQDSSGRTLAEALSRLLRQAGLAPADVSLYSAHGTATASNDLLEARALAIALGQYRGHARVMAAKSAMGHLLGAAGLTEAVLAMQAVRLGLLPPIPTLQNPDPHCDVQFVSAATPADLPVAVAASLGFGGQIGLLAIRRA